MSSEYPKFYAVSDRPVKLVELDNGGVDCLVFDWVTGGFLPDRSYFARISEVGIGKDVDALDRKHFMALVLKLRVPIVERLVQIPIRWERAVDPRLLFSCRIEGRLLQVRLNDFPAEPLYTLAVEGEEVADFDEFPYTWSKPK